MTYSNHHYQPDSHRRAIFSKHAEKRARSRGIDLASLPLVLSFGQREYDGQGGVRYLMTSESVAALRRAVGRSKQVESLAGVYAVVSVDGETVITAGHRHN